MSDYISRADAIEVLQQFAEDEKPTDEMSKQFQQYQRGRHLAFLQAVEEIKALPSADADGEDLIIKGAKGIQDGLYNIKDGKLFKYKANGGTVRTYPIVPSAEAEQVTSKLKNPCDSLLTEDSAECKEQKSKLEHDREWIIGCIKHDGFIKTDRFDKANQIIHDALSADTSSDLISRSNAIRWVKTECNPYGKPTLDYDSGLKVIEHLKKMPSELQSAEAKTKCVAQIKVDTEEIARRIKEEHDITNEWIPCSERLPSDDEIVNITWVNHNPPSYYADIAEKPFVASGLRYRDKWYWYSSVCQDLHQDFDLIDKDIEVIAWQPLPKPYKGGDTE